MTGDFFQAMLGVPEDASPQALLDLKTESSTPAEVYIALQRRFLTLQAHPQGAGREAQLVSLRLQSAARLLMNAHRNRTRRAKDEPSMPADVAMHFIGVREFSDPLTLLGFRADEHATKSIDEALADRLEAIEAHPQAASTEAEEMRVTLKAAAEMLKDKVQGPLLVNLHRSTSRPSAAPATKTSTPPPPVGAVAPTHAAQKPSLRTLGASVLLTPFDRQVLSVLIGCGGWNSTSRSLLVSLAETYQVSPDGLVKVVKGLSDYARLHRSRIGMREIAEAIPAERENGLPPQVASVRDPAASAPSSPVQAPHVEPGEAMRPIWNPVTLSLLAAIIMTILGISILAVVIPNVLLKPSEPTANVVEPIDGEVTEPTTPDESRSSPESNDDRLLAKFPSMPTFLGNGLPSAGADAADAGMSLTDDFDGIERRLSVTDEPSEAVYRDWAYFIDQFATGWVLMDVSSRISIEQSMLESLRLAADTPSVSDRFMQALTPLSGKLPEPIDVWRGSWKTYLLGRIINTRVMAPVVVDQARRQLELTLRTMPSDANPSARELARAWLEQATKGLIESVEYEPRSYDYWELWLSAQREFGDDAAHDGALLDALERLLRTGIDLARPGPGINVVGRLLGMIDWTRRDLLLDRLTRFFNDPEITNRDLWVLTSLFVRRKDLPWFTAALVLPEDADDRYRGRLRDRIGQAWPVIEVTEVPRNEDEGAPPYLDPIAVRPWLDLAQRMRALSVPEDDVGRMNLLLAASYGNEAFMHLLDQNKVNADEAFDLASRSLHELESREGDDGFNRRGETAESSRPAVKPGQPIGPDGTWSARFREARRDSKLRLDLLSELSSTAGTDLGAGDAEEFVRIVYRDASLEVRELAQSVLVTRFSRGPIVAMEMLDQLPDAPGGQRLSECIANLTGRILPDVGSDSWTLEARLALLDHALNRHRTGAAFLDVLVQELTDSYRRRSESSGVESGASGLPVDPDEAVRQLLEAWRTRASRLIARVTIPDDLPGLHRRRMARLELAEGPIQTFVAEQISAMELFAYITVATNPSRRSRVQELLAESASRRAEVESVLQQAIEVELTLVDLNRLRIEAASSRRSEGEGP